MMISKKIPLFFLTVFACVLFSAVASPRADDTAKDIGGLLPDNIVTKDEAPVYLQLTYPSLYRLAWSWGAYQQTDLDAVDSYLKVSECDLYQKFFKNEFEWEKIRKAAIKYLNTYGKKLSNYYEYVQPLELGRYDNDLEGFPLKNAEDFASLKVLQIADYTPGTTKCGQFSIDANKYPASALVNIISPLSLTFVHVSKKDAEAYIAWREKEGLEKEDNRIAYIKYRVRIDGYSGISKPSTRVNAFIFSGRLMEISVYADSEMLMPLYNQMF